MYSLYLLKATNSSHLLADVSQKLPFGNCLAIAVSEDKKSWLVLDGKLGLTEIPIKASSSTTSQQPRFSTPTKASGKRGMNPSQEFLTICLAMRYHFLIDTVRKQNNIQSREKTDGANLIFSSSFLNDLCTFGLVMPPQL